MTIDQYNFYVYVYGTITVLRGLIRAYKGILPLVSGGVNMPNNIILVIILIITALVLQHTPHLYRRHRTAGPYNDAEQTRRLPLAPRTLAPAHHPRARACARGEAAGHH